MSQNREKPMGLQNIKNTINNGRNIELWPLIKRIDNHCAKEYVSIHALYQMIYNPASGNQNHIFLERKRSLEALLDILDSLDDKLNNCATRYSNNSISNCL